MNDSELLERTLNITQGCLLPKLIDDFDTNPISSSDFNAFKVVANEKIYLLLDILYQNRFLLSDTQRIQDQVLQIRVNLLLITCEQVEENPYFHSDDRIMLRSLWNITFEHIWIFEDKVFSRVIQHYKNSLTKSEWKKNFGLIHGFPLFCKVMLQHKSNLVTDDLMLFMLSVGSNLVSNYEPYYKSLGLKIYMIMLQCGSSQQLKSLNIHQVVYSETLPLIGRSNEFDFNLYLYECIYLSLIMDLNLQVTDSKWNKYDDVMSKLIEYFSFENDVKLSRFLMYQIAKFTGAGYGNHFEIKSLKEIEELDVNYLNDLRTKINKPNLRVYRWISNIMQMLIRESLRMLNNIDDSKYFLHVYNIIYIVTIGSIKPTENSQNLEDFTKKFVLILIKVVKTFKGNRSIVSTVLSVISTIEQHQMENLELVKTLQNLKSHEILKI